VYARAFVARWVRARAFVSVRVRATVSVRVLGLSVLGACVRVLGAFVGVRVRAM